MYGQRPPAYLSWLPARQRSQAMVLTLLFGIATALITLILFNSAILANTKTRLQNAADASAYSAGVLLARDHNFSAYINRAMVANQVAVMQIASLKSYLEDAAATRKRMDGPALGTEALLPIHKPQWEFAVSLPVAATNSAFSAFAGPALNGLDVLIKAFEVAQEAHHVATAINMAQVTNEAIKRTGSTVQTSSKLLPGSDALRLQDGMRGDTLRALAAAQSYFYRSKVDGAGLTRSDWARGDGKTEVANLFRPYWQARLSDRSVADRGASWAAQ